jgi:hypothetical protein
MSENSKIYRIDWKYFDEKGVTEDYEYIGAETPEEAVGELAFDDEVHEYEVREASIEEVEAYVSGYEAGYDSAKVMFVLDTIINGENVSIDSLETDEKFGEIIKDIKIEKNNEDDK